MTPFQLALARLRTMAYAQAACEAIIEKTDEDRVADIVATLVPSMVDTRASDGIMALALTAAIVLKSMPDDKAARALMFLAFSNLVAEAMDMDE